MFIKSGQKTHGGAQSVYANTEPEDHGIQSADVTLICGVTDCWRRGHLLNVYFCPVLLCAVYFSVCLAQCNACQWLWWPNALTTMGNIFPRTWSSLNLARKWAQLSVPVWPLAYMVFLPLFKELNLIWVRCVVVWVKSVTPSKETKLHPLLLRQVIGWPLVSLDCVLIPL